MESSYDGPRLDNEITAEFMKSLIATFKAEKKLHRKYAYKVTSYNLSKKVHLRLFFCVIFLCNSSSKILEEKFFQF